jgi:hypothetical protein
VGEPLREAERLGVPAPGLKIVYGMCKILQLKIMEQKGVVKLPPKDNPTRPILELSQDSSVPT